MIEIELLIGLITAVSALATIIGGLVLKFVKLKQDITGKVHKFDDEIIWLAEQLEQTDQWVLEKEQDIKTVASVITNMSPDAKRFLEMQGVNIAQATIDITKIKNELERIKQIRMENLGTKTSIPQQTPPLPPTG